MTAEVVRGDVFLVALYATTSDQEPYPASDAIRVLYGAR